jgi:hypothetical protein
MTHVIHKEKWHNKEQKEKRDSEQKFFTTGRCCTCRLNYMTPPMCAAFLIKNIN